MATIYKPIIAKIDSTANWTTLNPTPAYGEQCIEILGGGLFKLKVGDGVTPWISLKYFQESFTGDIRDLITPDKTTLVAGINSVQREIDDLATVAKTGDYSDLNNKLTPGTAIDISENNVISAKDASDTRKGIARIATEQEVIEGTSETLIVNPLQLKNAIERSQESALNYKGICKESELPTSNNKKGDLWLISVFDVTQDPKLHGHNGLAVWNGSDWDKEVDEYLKPDNTTIEINQEQQNNLTAIGVKTKSDEIMYDWVGTLEEWEEGRNNETIPDEWICWITDDEEEPAGIANLAQVASSGEFEDLNDIPPLPVDKLTKNYLLVWNHRMQKMEWVETDIQPTGEYDPTTETFVVDEVQYDQNTNTLETNALEPMEII